MPIRKLREDEVEFLLKCEPEYIPIKGNASAIDEKTDREIEEWIIKQLDLGNEWAWCCVHVIAKWGNFEGHAYLGCCSYESEEDFHKLMYLPDLKSEALEDLNTKLAAISSQLDKLSSC